jgi:Holliday junction DNA helicase RuvB
MKQKNLYRKTKSNSPKKLTDLVGDEVVNLEAETSFPKNERGKGETSSVETTEPMNPALEYPNQEDSTTNITLRPENLNDFQGQSELKKRLLITLEASKSRKDCLPHQLFAGPPGLGKTTLACILAKEMGTEIKITSGPSLEKPGDLATTLVSLKNNDILFIDEIHRLSPVIEEFLYPAMEDKKLDILVESEGGPKSIRIDLSPFTLIGATTKPGNLSAPLRGRFQTIHRLELYNLNELKEIIKQSAKKLSMTIDEYGAEEIAIRSRGTPRTANNHLLWVRDYATAKLKTNHICRECALEALDAIAIDKEGLDPTDRKILDTLCRVFAGGPVGIQSLSVACSEDPISIEDMHEPYLIAQGYLKRTPQGRVASNKTRELYGIKRLPSQGELGI